MRAQPAGHVRLNRAHFFGRYTTGAWLFNRPDFRNIAQPAGPAASISGSPALVTYENGICVSGAKGGRIDTPYTATQLGINGARKRTILFEYLHPAGYGGPATLFSLGGTNSGGNEFCVRIVNANQIQLGGFYADSQFNATPGGVDHVVQVALTYDGSTLYCYAIATGSDGVTRYPSSNGTNLNTSDDHPLSFLNTTFDHIDQFTSQLRSVVILSDYVATNAEIERYFADPNALYAAPSGLRSRVAAIASAVAQPVAGAVLAASAYTPSTSGAALATAISLQATSTTPTNAGAALATGIAISGGSTTTSTAGASLSTGNSFSASSTTASAAGAALATSIRLAGGAASPSTAGVALSTSIPISAGAVSPSTAGASLATWSTWSAGSASPSNAGAALQTAIRLAPANASVPSQAGAVLATAVRLAASSATPSSAGAALATGTSKPAIDVAQIDPAHVSVFAGTGSRVAVFSGSGSRVAVFAGSGPRLNLNGVNVKLPTLVNGKMTTDRDPDEISWYAADITQELADRATTPLDASKLLLDLSGVALVQGPLLQTATTDSVTRTYVVVLLGGIDGALPADWHWTARVPCANGERFDKTTYFNRVDT